MKNLTELYTQSDALEIKLARVNRQLETAKGTEKRALLKEKEELMNKINLVIEQVLEIEFGDIEE